MRIGGASDALGYRPYRAKTLGWVPAASRIRMGMLGLLRFMVGYDRVRNDLCRRKYGSVHMFLQLYSPSVIILDRWRFQFLQLTSRNWRSLGSKWYGLNVPDSRALFRSLAEEESHLAERFRESVLGRHAEA